MGKLAVIEFNELNIDAVREYGRAGQMPNFVSFIERHGITETQSEVDSAELEPWIQWVTAHTGKSFAEHGLFRLGDGAYSDVEQVWDILDGKGYVVGAISPMNAANRVSSRGFFLPDPWTKTGVTGPSVLKGLSDAVSKVVNENATGGGMETKSLLQLLSGFLAYASPSTYPRYVSMLAQVRNKPWNKALILDTLLTDIFVTFARRKRADFCTVFLNAAAHLQHHYMFNSRAYKGSQRNPDWYLAPGSDAVGDAYRTYDFLLGRVLKALPDHRVMIMTGLHQDPTSAPVFYWRLRDHGDLMRRLGINFSDLTTLMSRDFVLRFSSVEDMQAGATKLGSARIGETPVFNVNVRRERNELFVELVYPDDIPPKTSMLVGNAVIDDFRREVAFVALKNGQHNSVGYLGDSACSARDSDPSIPLTAVFDRMLAAVQ